MPLTEIPKAKREVEKPTWGSGQLLSLLSRVWCGGGGIEPRPKTVFFAFVMWENLVKWQQNYTRSVPLLLEARGPLERPRGFSSPPSLCQFSLPKYASGRISCLLCSICSVVCDWFARVLRPFRRTLNLWSHLLTTFCDHLLGVYRRQSNFSLLCSSCHFFSRKSGNLLVKNSKPVSDKAKVRAKSWLFVL